MQDIQVIPYSSSWLCLYKMEEKKIHEALNPLATYHIGSTAIPGLPAKPIIDILTVIPKNTSPLIALVEAGWSYKGEWNIPFRFGFNKRGDIAYNLHVYEEGHPEISLNLCFRDYIQAHPNLKKEYTDLKYKLLKDPQSFIKKEGRNFTGYTLGKNAFIHKVLQMAEYKALRWTKCSHDQEWEAARKLIGHLSSPPLILYRGVELIGLAMLKKDKPYYIFYHGALDESEKKQCVKWIERWWTTTTHLT